MKCITALRCQICRTMNTIVVLLIHVAIFSPFSFFNLVKEPVPTKCLK